MRASAPDLTTDDWWADVLRCLPAEDAVLVTAWSGSLPRVEIEPKDPVLQDRTLAQISREVPELSRGGREQLVLLRLRLIGLELDPKELFGILEEKAPAVFDRVLAGGFDPDRLRELVATELSRARREAAVGANPAMSSPAKPSTAHQLAAVNESLWRRPYGRRWTGRLSSADGQTLEIVFLEMDGQFFRLEVVDGAAQGRVSAWLSAPGLRLVRVRSGQIEVAGNEWEPLFNWMEHRIEAWVETPGHVEPVLADVSAGVVVVRARDSIVPGYVALADMATGALLRERMTGVEVVYLLRGDAAGIPSDWPIVEETPPVVRRWTLSLAGVTPNIGLVREFFTPTALPLTWAK